MKLRSSTNRAIALAVGLAACQSSSHDDRPPTSRFDAGVSGDATTSVDRETDARAEDPVEPVKDASPPSRTPADASAEPDAGNDTGVPPLSDGGPGTARSPVSSPNECAVPNSVGDGLACSCSADCTAGARCVREEELGLPHGACIRTCNSSAAGCSSGAVCDGAGVVCSGACSSDADCFAGGTCEAGACCLPGYCMPACSTHADCTPARVCLDGSCWPLCNRDDDCDKGRCDLNTHACQPERAERKGAGAVCTRDEDCRSEFCDPRSFCRTECLPGALDCPEGTACVGIEGDPNDPNYLCLPSCETDADCFGDTQGCANFRGTSICRPRTRDGCTRAPGSVAPGYPCDCDEECQVGTCGVEMTTGVAHGICKRACAADADCGPSAKCNAAGECAARCGANTPCPVGRACLADGSCTPACRSDADCTTGHCDPYSLFCRGERSGAGIQGSCVTHSDCKSGFCAASTRMCMSICLPGADRCPESASCVPWDAASELGFCFLGCDADADCPVGLYCMFDPGLGRTLCL